MIKHFIYKWNWLIDKIGYVCPIKIYNAIKGLIRLKVSFIKQTWNKTLTQIKLHFF